MTPEREEQLRRINSPDPAVRDAYYREAIAKARADLESSTSIIWKAPTVSTPSVTRLSTGEKGAAALFNIIASACTIYLLIWLTLAHAWLPLATVLILNVTKSCWVSIRLSALDHPKEEK